MEREKGVAWLPSDVAIGSSFGAGNELNGRLFLKPEGPEIFRSESNHPYLLLARQWVGYSEISRAEFAWIYKNVFQFESTHPLM